jgi:hypothetical protein
MAWPCVIVTIDTADETGRLSVEMHGWSMCRTKSYFSSMALGCRGKPLPKSDRFLDGPITFEKVNDKAIVPELMQNSTK